MDIFKLFFNHDQRLDKLAKRNANKTPKEIEATLQDFMTPTPTFSKFYFTGTRLDKENFGINQLNKYPAILDTLDEIFADYKIFSSAEEFSNLSEAIENTEIGPALVITKNMNLEIDIDSLQVDEESNVGHLKDELREVLLDGHKVLYKEQAKNGFDLHLFSKDNIYSDFFYPFKTIVDENFRFFSINSNRMRSEQQFYFETWTLDHPPHGTEEVLPETAL